MIQHLQDSYLFDLYKSRTFTTIFKINNTIIMENISTKRIIIVFNIILYTVTCFSQQVTTVSQALQRISYSTPPYKNAKSTPYPCLDLFPPTVEGISDKLYLDLQCKTFISASINLNDMGPSLYMKFKIPNSDFTMGAVTFGGVTDTQVERIFITDRAGYIKSSMDAFIGFANVSIRQFQLTSDYKVIIYELVPTSATIIKFTDLIDQDNKTVQCYRLDTTYSINSNGQFEKEGEKKYPVKNYTVKQITDLNAWDL